MFSADGTFWAVSSYGLLRFDGSEWNRWSLPDTGFMASYVGPFEVAPDGSVWFAVGGDPGASCDGVGHFDGVTGDRHLPSRCVEAIDITADGSVWLLATEPDDNLRHVYVITPEAVAASLAETGRQEEG